MTEFPILFSGPMVKALLADNPKTVTRRIPNQNNSRWIVGSKLWVKETWSPDHAAFYPHFPVVYRADGDITDSDIVSGTVHSPEANRAFPFRWRPSIHCPRRVSRITLEIISLRDEPLQNIMEDDAVREGFESECVNEFPEVRLSPREMFAALWDQLNGDKPGFTFADNPIIRRIEFRRVDQ